jgi:hypothetical protein
MTTPLRPVNTPERLGREGDSQAMPVPNDSAHIHDLVAADLAARKALGVRRYGTPLQAGNGRDALQDMYEELLDACVYAKQRLMEDQA